MTLHSARQRERMPNLFALTWPIFIELALHMLMGIVDTYMLGQYDDNAVAAVGVVNQLNNTMNLLFTVVGAGTTILIARKLGAGDRSGVPRFAASALTMNLVFGLLVSILLLSTGRPILRVMGLQDELMPYAVPYLNLTGGLIFVQALLLTASAGLKSHGLTRQVMLVSVFMNVIHVLGNYIALHGFLGIPVYGVQGVAVSTVCSRAVGFILMLVLLLRVLDHKPAWSDYIRLRVQHMKELLGIGIPSAGEQLSYNISQLVITGFIATLGVTAMITRVYTFHIIYLITLFSLAIAQGTQILVARLIGAQDRDGAYRVGFRSLAFGIGISLIMAGFYNLIGGMLLGLFTDNQEVIALGRKLLLLAFLLEPGRAFNLILISALRAAGDVRYPVYVGIVFMWGLAVPSAYLFGIHLDMGLYGILSAFVVDEWVRGILMAYRWRKRKWAALQQTGVPAAS
ncbi:putative MATE family efflux protein [Paenibacillus phyllosphaerae]|uniref:Putative MATE family efflux protein n=1 Tax=Paenibacillus phyllosphaerae TaxID=274593 RepID=A0A7W5FRK1_9BACL|nr:MATE family efflux transporter [Paenibacillus phyllosphaerae]MBB3114611.1 putative MATE family efflux protein [Paenibacillus phyllosphaerae]